MLIKVTAIFLMAVCESYQHLQADCSNIISREEWGAVEPENNTNYLPQNPPPYVVVHHSETPACSSSEKCKQRIKNIQHFHMNERGWADIGYNFLIGGDGNVYEGRGWGIQGAHHPKYNSRSIGICLIGSFQSSLPPSVQMNAFKNLIACAARNNKITTDYHLIGHRQGRDTTCPGDALFNEIKRMPHWDSNPN